MNFNWKEEYHRYRRYFFDFGKITKTVQARSFAWLSLTIFTVSFFSIMAIRPTLVTIAKLNREIKDKKEANQKLQSKINAVIAAQAEFAKNLDNLSLLEDAFPDKSEFPRLAFFIEENASASGVELNSLSFEKINTGQKTTKEKGEEALPFSPLNFSLGVGGDYFRLRDFLKALEASRRMIKISSVSFSQVKKGETLGLSLQVSGQASFGKGGE